VQLRCANIIQSVAKDALPSKIASLTVSCKHGVRTLFDRGDFIGSDSTTIVYKVGVSGDVLRDKNIESMGAESVIKLCDVYTNIIPDLDFLPDTRPPGLRSKR